MIVTGLLNASLDNLWGSKSWSESFKNQKEEKIELATLLLDPLNLQKFISYEISS